LDNVLHGYERSIRAAQGYWELGMCEDALLELDTIPGMVQDRPDVLEMRLVVLMHIQRWHDALNVSRRLIEVMPRAAAGFIHQAFCLHELGETTQARKTLLEGPESLLKEPTYHYNLACYECILGNLEAARRHLEASVMMDSRFREFALKDPDLKALREL
jgi:predicted Zn-dependent protease